MRSVRRAATNNRLPGLIFYFIVIKAIINSKKKINYISVSI